MIMRDKVTKQCPHTTNFEVKGDPKQIRTKIPLLASLTNALPLGQTGSHPGLWNFLHLKPGVGRVYFVTARNFFLVLTSNFPVHWPSFLPNPLPTFNCVRHSANAISRVGPRHKRVVT